MNDRATLFLQFYAICRQAGDAHSEAVKCAEECTTAALEKKAAAHPEFKL